MFVLNHGCSIYISLYLYSYISKQYVYIYIARHGSFVDQGEEVQGKTKTDLFRSHILKVYIVTFRKLKVGYLLFHRQETSS